MEFLSVLKKNNLLFTLSKDIVSGDYKLDVQEYINFIQCSEIKTQFNKYVDMTKIDNFKITDFDDIIVLTDVHMKVGCIKKINIKEYDILIYQNQMLHIQDRPLEDVLKENPKFNLLSDENVLDFVQKKLKIETNKMMENAVGKTDKQPTESTSEPTSDTNVENEVEKMMKEVQDMFAGMNKEQKK